jgi:DNA-binding response OmpR family regulator
MHKTQLASSETPHSKICVLALIPSDHDHETLHRMLPQQNWNVNRVKNVASALHELGNFNENPALVLCDRDSGPGAWKLILSRVQEMSNPPLLIVTSRLADEQLWAEALNLGAYDVLAKPFEEAEVRRTLSSASMRWQRDGQRAQAAS